MVLRTSYRREGEAGWVGVLRDGRAPVVECGHRHHHRDLSTSRGEAAQVCARMILRGAENDAAARDRAHRLRTAWQALASAGGFHVPVSTVESAKYQGSFARHARTCAERLADQVRADGDDVQVLVLSALHGLVALDDVLDPYDVELGDPGSITRDQLAVQAQLYGLDGDGSTVQLFLANDYDRLLSAALQSLYVYPLSGFEGCAGNGEQRRVLSLASRPDTPEAGTGSAGLQVWVGADASGFAWGQKILVNYGRLREVVTLPVALAAWVCDSRAFTEIGQYQGWRFTARQYAADLLRFAAEIGKLQWAAPMDWPASAALLAITGLTEDVHQDYTTDSVIELRHLVDGKVHIIPVVTGTTLDGYLRHGAKYAAAGIDLTREPLVGIGALVGRPAAEAAAIVRALHAAGVTRLHGLGVKNEVVELVGPLLTSIDSANWSRDARYEVGRCPHGEASGVVWEANCPIAAAEFAAAQRDLASGRPVQEMLPLFAGMGTPR
ncbi:hypothetical protein [Actinoplanes sp. L3-i22]|uniref:deazapurine DNA modification protein DpdA family protein n=1 Tax=Actinoplanes sp. L3-i22 TaxID=2836373 RepID=UPI001C747521|nr:hypothetical protein [Actinoplanes sp. L3-i22]BCY11010.1 hypothetical protein L3i22_060980 [Actinoplanes sp. L3-i22]